METETISQGTPLWHGTTKDYDVVSVPEAGRYLATTLAEAVVYASNSASGWMHRYAAARDLVVTRIETDDELHALGNLTYRDKDRSTILDGLTERGFDAVIYGGHDGVKEWAHVILTREGLLEEVARLHRDDAEFYDEDAYLASAPRP